MATCQMNRVIQHIRRTVRLPAGAGMTDGQLLETFITWRDESAFAVLVSRHGPMVLGVCRRVLRNHHDAEDAFQSTFLVLARKASSVRPRERVANWLHGVALRTALKARTIRVKKQVRERQVTALPEPAVVPKDAWADLHDLLDQELSRLPDTYRLPIILCDLEAKSIKEATEQLGCPQGTLAGRLARARKMLAKRLTQRGVILSGGALAVALSEQTAPASVPPSLAGSTLKAAVAIAAGKTAAGMISAPVAALTEGVVKGMMLTKCKTVIAILLVVGMAFFGSGSLTHPMAEADEIKGERDVVNSSQHPAVPSKTEVPSNVYLPNGAQDYNAIFERVENVLKDYFSIHYANRFEGRIESAPSRARRQLATGTFIRRRAFIQIVPLDQGGFSVNVHVSKEVKSVEEARKDTPAFAEAQWKPTGRDTELEQAILRRLAAPGAREGTVPKAKTREAKESSEESKLHGEWVSDDAQAGHFSVTFGPKNTVRRINQNGDEAQGTFSVDWSMKPYPLDLKWGKGPVGQTIMEFTQEGKLRIEDGGDQDGSRPKAFTNDSILLTKKEVSAADAAKDLAIADFYRRSGHLGSAYFYYELVKRRYPNTEYARLAADVIARLKQQRIRRADGSVGWESPEPQLPQPAPQIAVPPPMPVPPPMDSATPAKMGSSKTVILENAKIVIDAGANMRLVPVKTGMKHLVRLELAGIRVEVPRLKIESATDIVEIEATSDGQFTTRTFLKPKTARVGQVIVAGNTKTPTSEILKKIPIIPGQILAYPDLRVAEKNLAGWQATVTVLEDNEGAEFKDILVTVKEK